MGYPGLMSEELAECGEASLHCVRNVYFVFHVSHHENYYLLAIRSTIFSAILSFELFFCVLFACYLYAMCLLFLGYPGVIH